MKKLLLGLLLIPFLNLANVIDDLEAAIQKGNTPKVQELIQDPSLTRSDLIPLIDLAQQMIYFHKGHYECHLVNLNLYRSKGSDFLGLIISLLGFMSSPLILASQKGFEVKRIAPFSLAAIGCMISMSFFGKRLSNNKNDFYDGLKANINNAMKIKQILLRHNAMAA